VAITVDAGDIHNRLQLQTKIDDNPGKTVRVSGTVSLLAAELPILIRTNQGLAFENATIVQEQSRHSHAIVVSPVEDPLPLGTSLIPGPGNAFRMDPDSFAYFNLRDSLRTHLNGIDSIRITWWYDFLGGDGNMMESSGLRSHIEGRAQALRVERRQNDKVSAEVTTTSGLYEVKTPGPVPNGPHRFDLDLGGGWLRLFVDHVLVDEVAAPGSIVQRTHEIWSVGAHPTWWPEGNDGLHRAADGWIDAISITPSRGAQLPTPTSFKPLHTSNRLVVNFETHADGGPFVKCQEGNAITWLLLRRQLDDDPELITGRTEGLQIEQGEGGLGILGQRAQGFVFERTKVTGGRSMINLRNNCFNSKVRGLEGVLTSSDEQACLTAANGTWNFTAEGLNCSTRGYGIVADRASGSYRSSFVNGCREPTYFFRGLPVVIEGLSASDEAQQAPHEAALMLVDITGLVVRGSGFWSTKADGPVVIAHEVRGAFDGTTFVQSLGHVTPVFKLEGENKIDVRDPNRIGTSPWSIGGTGPGVAVS
jgi:hypothetical protein